MEKYIGFLQEIDIFQGIETEKLPLMLQCLGAAKKHYKKEQIIFMAGDAVAEVGVLLMGKIQIVQEDIFGNRTIIDQLTAGHLFAETFICAGIKKALLRFLP